MEALEFPQRRLGYVRPQIRACALAHIYKLSRRPVAFGMSLKGSSSEPMALSIMASTLFLVDFFVLLGFLDVLHDFVDEVFNVCFDFDGFVAGVAAERRTRVRCGLQEQGAGLG